MRSLAVIAAACAGLAVAPAWSQSWQTWSRDDGAGAGICPVDDAETANDCCLTLSCPVPGAPAEIAVQFAGGELAGPPYGLEVFDGITLRGSDRALGFAPETCATAEIVAKTRPAAARCVGGPGRAPRQAAVLGGRAERRGDGLPPRWAVRGRDGQ